MGKHDKQERTVFSWEPMPDEWYKARIKQLESENKRLTEELDTQKAFVGFLSTRLESTEDNNREEVAHLEKALLNAAKTVWG